MTDAPMPMRDAAVALRSLPRRFREVLAGPAGDDAWERLVRTPSGARDRSALGWLRHTTTAVTVLGTAVATLPLTAKPDFPLKSIAMRPCEPGPDDTIASLLDELAQVAERAAAAVEGRQPGDFDRLCNVDGTDVAARDLVSRIIRLAVGHLDDAAGAIDDARSI